jgi:hypothetical protein
MEVIGMSKKDDTYNEDVKRLARDIREFLETDANNFSDNIKNEALRIVYHDGLRVKSKSTSIYIGNPYTIGRRGIVY